MTQTVLVIGGAGKVGRGIVQAFRDAGSHVVVVDPAGEDLAEPATPDLASRVGTVNVAVVSLAARGLGRAAGEFRPADAAATELPGRLAALELAVATLSDGGCLIELASGSALEEASDEAALIGSWQRGIHSGFAQAGIRGTLCAITCYVDPEGPGVGEQIRELAGSGRTGLCRLDAVGGPVEWVD